MSTSENADSRSDIVLNAAISRGPFSLIRHELRVAIIEETECSGFTAVALNIDGIVGQGETIDEAINDIVEAFKITSESYKEANQPIPWLDPADSTPAPVGAQIRWVSVDG